MSKLVAIAYGEIPPDCGPDEAEMVALCEEVAEVLQEKGCRTNLLEIKLDLRATTDTIQTMKPDLIFNLVDTIDGYSVLGHLAPQLFEYLEIPFTGGSSEAIYLTTNKELAKRWLTLHDIPSPQTWHPGIKKGQFLVKSLTEDGSIGIGPENCVKATDAIAKLIATKEEQYGGKWFAEQYVDGREFNVAMMGGEILPISEIVFEYPAGKPKIVDYASKWMPNSFEYKHTKRRFDFPKKDTALLQELERLSLRCWDVFNLSGYARIDFRVDEENNPYVLEVNVNPCLDRDAGFAASAARAGMPYEILIQEITAHV